MSDRAVTLKLTELGEFIARLERARRMAVEVCPGLVKDIDDELRFARTFKAILEETPC
jgi:hypothetical protein